MPYVILYDGAVKKFPDGREVCLKTAGGKREYRDRTLAMRLRQHYACSFCGMAMLEEDTTFDHDIPRGFGGSRRDDRIVDDAGRMMNSAMHSWCNREKGSKRLE